MKRTELIELQFEPRDGYERSVIFDDKDFQVNAKVHIVKVMPGQRIRPHKHAQRSECFRIVSGQGEIRMDSQIVATDTNTLVLCEPGDVHEVVNTSQTETLLIEVFRTNDPGDKDMIWVEEEA